MISFSLTQLASILSASIEQAKDCLIDNVVIDSRKVTQNSLFIALKGERFDGHDFAEQAVQQGVAALVVERPLPLAIPQLIVTDSRLALGQLAQWLRAQMCCHVVVLTGSAGKTSVKELTASILMQCGNVLYTSGNLNNDIGVPLTLLRLQPHHQFAVIELGANHAGEIAYSSALAQPRSALINNIGEAHLSGFGSLTGVAQAKGEIFANLPTTGIAIINAEDRHYLPLWQPALANKQIWSFSLNSEADFYASELRLNADKTLFTLQTPLGACQINLPLLGQHNVINAIAASALAMSVGADLKAIQTGLERAKPIAGRLYPIYLNQNQLLLDDSYNANVTSMYAAIDVLAQMPGYRVLVIGDMAELGDNTEHCHEKVGLHAQLAALDEVLSVGQFSQYISQHCLTGHHFTSKSQLVAHLIKRLKQYPQITLLIKGSRSAAMEQIINEIKGSLLC